jgi:hypothetical protein
MSFCSNSRCNTWSGLFILKNLRGWPIFSYLYFRPLFFLLATVTFNRELMRFGFGIYCTNPDPIGDNPICTGSCDKLWIRVRMCALMSGWWILTLCLDLRPLIRSFVWICKCGSKEVKLFNFIERWLLKRQLLIGRYARQLLTGTTVLIITSCINSWHRFHREVRWRDEHELVRDSPVFN